MARKFFGITEVIEVCCVTEEFVDALERENLIRSVNRNNERRYSLDQVDRIRVAQNLVRELGVNFEGVEVALHMRDQIIQMRRQMDELWRRAESRLNQPRHK
jgi:DNA-binding transcriptional MerR regulator